MSTLILDRTTKITQDPRIIGLHKQQSGVAGHPLAGMSYRAPCGSRMSARRVGKHSKVAGLHFRCHVAPDSSPSLPSTHPSTSAPLAPGPLPAGTASASDAASGAARLPTSLSTTAQASVPATAGPQPADASAQVAAAPKGFGARLTAFFLGEKITKERLAGVGAGRSR